MTSGPPPDLPASRPYPPPAPEQRGRKPIRPVDVVTVAGGVLALLAAAMPWVTYADQYGRAWQSGHFDGYTGNNGGTTVLLGALAVMFGAAAIAGLRSVLLGLGTIAVGAGSVFFAGVGIQLIRIHEVNPDLLRAGIDVTAGVGSWLWLLSGAVMFIAGLMVVCRADPGRPELGLPDRVALLGGLFVFAATWLPWATQIHPDGRIQLVGSWDSARWIVVLLGVGAMLATAVAVATDRGWLRAVPPVLGVAAVVQAVLLIFTARTSWFLYTPGGITDPGPGMFAVLLGGGLLLASGAMLL